MLELESRPVRPDTADATMLDWGVSPSLRVPPLAGAVCVSVAPSPRCSHLKAEEKGDTDWMEGHRALPLSRSKPIHPIHAVLISTPSVDFTVKACPAARRRWEAASARWAAERVMAEAKAMDADSGSCTVSSSEAGDATPPRGVRGPSSPSRSRELSGGGEAAPSSPPRPLPEAVEVSVCPSTPVTWCRAARPGMDSAVRSSRPEAARLCRMPAPGPRGTCRLEVLAACRGSTVMPALTGILLPLDARKGLLRGVVKLPVRDVRRTPRARASWCTTLNFRTARTRCGLTHSASNEGKAPRVPAPPTPHASK